MTQQKNRSLPPAISTHDARLGKNPTLYPRLKVLGLDPNPVDPHAIDHLMTDTKDIPGYFRMDHTLLYFTCAWIIMRQIPIPISLRKFATLLGESHNFKRMDRYCTKLHHYFSVPIPIATYHDYLLFLTQFTAIPIEMLIKTRQFLDYIQIRNKTNFRYFNQTYFDSTK